MDDDKLQAIAEAMLRKLLEGGDVIEIEKVEEGRWRIRLLTPAAG